MSGTRTRRPWLAGVVFLVAALWALWWIWFGLLNVLFSGDEDDTVVGGVLFIGVGVASFAAAVLWVVDRPRHAAVTRWLVASALLAWLLGLAAGLTSAGEPAAQRQASDDGMSRLASLAAAFVVLAACGVHPDRTTAGGEPATSVEPADIPLVGTTWVLDPFTPGSERTADHPYVRFETNGFVGAFDGCNGYGWATLEPNGTLDGLAYRIDGDEIEFEGSFTATLKACATGVHDEVPSMLVGTVAFDIDGDHLRLGSTPDQVADYTAER